MREHSCEVALQYLDVRTVPPRPKKQKGGVAPTLAQPDRQSAAVDIDNLLDAIKDEPADRWAGSRRLGGATSPPVATGAGNDAMDVDGWSGDAQGKRAHSIADNFALIGCDVRALGTGALVDLTRVGPAWRLRTRPPCP